MTLSAEYLVPTSLLRVKHAPGVTRKKVTLNCYAECEIYSDISTEKKLGEVTQEVQMSVYNSRK